MDLTAEEIAVLRIDNFIFHVVHHGEEEPILLDETPIGTFERFFLDRVKETLRGNRFEFLEGSATLISLKKATAVPDRFVDQSKVLARNFHSRHDKQIKAGVLIVMRLSTGSRRLYSLIKYDHEETLAYDLVNDTQGILKEIANSFTKSAEALHKSALIELSGTGGELVVIDRTVRHDITAFFKGFLNCKRKFTSTEMTKQVETIVVSTVKAHQNDLPGEITQAVRERFYECVKRRDAFDAGQFFSEYFGAHGNASVRKTFDRLVESNGIAGELFTFDRSVVRRPGPKKYKTAEGVKIEIPEQALETFSKSSSDGFHDRHNQDQKADRAMSADAAREVRRAFDRLRRCDRALFTETADSCRVDEVRYDNVDILNDVKTARDAAQRDHLGEIAIYGSIYGRVDLNADMPDLRDESITVLFTKSVTPAWCFFITADGLRSAFDDGAFNQQARAIWVAEECAAFSSATMHISGWDGPRQPPSPIDRVERPRRLVRDHTHRRTPEDISPWLLIEAPTSESAAFSAWRTVAIHNLIFTIPSEVRSIEGEDHVVLKGPRSMPIAVTPTTREWEAKVFENLTAAVSWIYLVPRDAETKFAFLNNHLSLDWREGMFWPDGLLQVLEGSLNSAREAFAFHLRDESKDALKSLADLRKGLQEEVAKTQQSTRDLLSALWRDIVIAGAVLAVRNVTGSLGTGAEILRLLTVGTAILLGVSLMVTIISNARFHGLSDRSRHAWRSKLYGFMSGGEWERLVEKPIRSGRWIYRAVLVSISILYLGAIFYLLRLAGIGFAVHLRAIVERLAAIVWPN